MTASDGSQQNEEASRQARGAGVNLLTLLAQGALPAFHVQMARLLGRASYGQYVWANTVVDFGSAVTLFGMDIAISREVALAYEAGDEARAIQAVGTALRLVILTGFAVALVLGLGATAIASRTHMAGVENPLRVLTLMPIAYHASSILLVATQSRGIMRYDFWTRGLFQPICLLLSTTVLLRLGFGVTAACAGVSGAMVLTTFFAASCFGRVFPLRPVIRAVFRGPMDRRVLQVGLPMTAIALLWALQGRLDNTVLGAVLGPAESGAYGACILYAVTIDQMRRAFIPGLHAKLPSLLLRGDRAGMKALIDRTQRWVALLAAPLFVGFVVFGRDLLTVFGRDFPDAAPALALLAVAQLFGAMSIPAQTIVIGSRRGASVVAAAASVAVQGTLLLPLLHRYGMVGAAASTALGMLVAQTVQQVWAWRLYRVHGFSWALARVYLAAAIAAIVGKGLLTLLPVQPLPRFLVAVTAAALVYLAALAALGLGDDERAWLLAIRRRMAAARPPPP